MAAKINRDILWEVGCEGHVDAWVNAKSWEEATVAAAEFWGVPWKEVAAQCEMKKKVVGAPRNICCRCGKMYYGAPPMCTMCEKDQKLEEEHLRRRLTRAYQLGKVM